MEQTRPTNVRFGSKADIEASSPDVRFTPKSGYCPARVGCPLCAKSRHSALQRRMSLFDHLVGTGEKRRRHVDSECLGGLKIYEKFELGRLFNRQFTWLGTF